ncbi:MAG: HAMP domain-containing sensor histidine kinase [Candidatus Omnitrophica bacterium]|nr:HAMP domain-containing sensor histidine kinase [Candidatus Omnitrophota bacterium]
MRLQRAFSFREGPEEVERLKKEFLSIASHELRTPLTTIKSSISLVSDGTTGPLNDEQRKFLEMADRNIDRLAFLIDNFFLLADLESGGIELMKTEVDINEIIASAMAIYAEPARSNGIALIFEPDKTLEKIEVDKRKIYHSVNNLISNAVKFSGSGKVIRIVSSRHSEDGDFIRVSVKDTGIGIDAKDFENIFDKFRQVDNSMTRQFPGSGIGLAICKRVIELHNGKVWVESEIGKGSTFHFILPAKQGKTAWKKY